MLNRKGRKVGHNPSSWNTKTVCESASGVISSRRGATSCSGARTAARGAPFGRPHELKPGPSGQQRRRRTPRVFRGTGVYLDGTPVGSFSINLTGHLFSALSLAAERLGRRHAPAFFEQRLRSCDAYAGHLSLVCIAPQQINHKGRVFVHHAFTQAWMSTHAPLDRRSPSHHPLRPRALSSITSSLRPNSTQCVKLAGIQSNRHFLQRGPVLIFRVGFGFGECVKGILMET